MAQNSQGRPETGRKLPNGADWPEETHEDGTPRVEGNPELVEDHIKDNYRELVEVDGRDPEALAVYAEDNRSPHLAAWLRSEKFDRGAGAPEADRNQSPKGRESARTAGKSTT